MVLRAAVFALHQGRRRHLGVCSQHRVIGTRDRKVNMTMRQRCRPALAALLGALLALPAVAQSASAPTGPGWGPGMRAGPQHTPGWSMMTPEERRQHHTKVTGFKSTEECRAYLTQHREQMAERAKARGTVMRGPRGDTCAVAPAAAAKP